MKRNKYLQPLQKHLNIGYNYAARLIEQLEKDKVITPEGKQEKRNLLDNYQPPIEEEVIKEENVKNEQQKLTGRDPFAGSKRRLKMLYRELPIKGIKLIFIQKIPSPRFISIALIAGILKIYMENSKWLKLYMV